MKIAIVGAGVSGLAVYHHLVKHFSQHPSSKDQLQLSLFESHDVSEDKSDSNRAGVPLCGGTYGVAANGMAALRRIGAELHDHVMKNGYPTPRFQIKTAHGATLGCIPTVDSTKDSVECCVMVTREAVIEALRMKVPSSAITYARVTDVKDGDVGAILTFADGHEETYDLVIGADGVWSRARKAVFGDEYAAEYKGLFTVGGFAPSHYLSEPPKSASAPYSNTVMIFGPNGFFAMSPYTKSATDVTPEHINGNVLLPPGDMSFWWSRSEQSDPDAKPSDEAIKQELKQRHRDWKDSALHKILDDGTIDFKGFPAYVHPDAPTWSGKRVVLIGDAAHTMPTSSGQGVSQSLEDAEALGALIAHNLAALGTPIDQPEQQTKAFSKTFKQYEKVRKAHVEAIVAAGNRAGDSSREMGKVAEYIMYTFFWVASRFFSSMFTKEITAYDLPVEIEKVKRKSDV